MVAEPVGEGREVQAGEALAYLIEMGAELADLSVKAGAPAAATHFLEAVIALKAAAYPAKAAPGDAA